MKKTSVFSRFLASFGLAVLVLTALTGNPLAAEFIGPQGEEGNVTVSAESEHKNLYVAGANILVNSKTLGDLYVAGGNVTVEGDVESDVVAAGGTVYLNGLVGGDIRVAGGNITINDAVAGDLIVLGGTVTVSEKAKVGGDVVVLGGEVDLQSEITGKLIAYTESFLLNNKVGGGVKIEATRSVVFGEKAVVTAGQYKSVEEAQITAGAQVSNLAYEKLSRKDQGKAAGAMAGIISFAFLVKLAAMIIAAILLTKMFPRSTETLVNMTHNKFWINLLAGFLFIVVGPIAVLISLFTMIGFYAALVFLVFWILLLMIAVVLSQVYVGSLLMKYFNKREKMTVDWQALVLGVVVLSLLGIIPFIGWLIMFVLVMVTAGSLLLYVYQVSKAEQPALPVEETL